MQYYLDIHNHEDLSSKFVQSEMIVLANTYRDPNIRKPDTLWYNGLCETHVSGPSCRVPRPGAFVSVYSYTRHMSKYPCRYFVYVVYSLYIVYVVLYSDIHVYFDISVLQETYVEVTTRSNGEIECVVSLGELVSQLKMPAGSEVARAEAFSGGIRVLLQTPITDVSKVNRDVVTGADSAVIAVDA